MQKKPTNKITGAFLGTITEYYDYSLYGFSANIIAEKFFSENDYLTNLIYVYAVYAVAYLSKPIGSIIFGRIGDLYGRKLALTITIVGIVIPTMVIGLLPEYSSIGVLSTIILIICRFAQGVFIGGEYDGAAIYVIEHLGPKYKFTASSVTRCTGVIGLLLGIGVTNLFNAHIFPEWGWRIPFLLSLPLALITIYYRSKFDETPEFKKLQLTKVPTTPLTALLIKQWKIVTMLIFFAGGFGVTYQIAIIFMKQYLPIILPQTTFVISIFSIIIVLCFAIAMPIAGFLADRIGVMKIISASLAGTILSSIFFMIATNYQMTNLALASCLMLATSVAPFNALAHGIVIKNFSVQERYRAISFGHTIGSMLMSGTANYICLFSMEKLNFSLFPIIYLVIFACIAYYAVRLLSCKTSIMGQPQYDSFR